MFAFPFFLLAAGFDGTWSTVFEAAGWLCGIPGVVLGYVALVQYVPLGIAALKDGRAGRNGPIPEVPA
jgi:hypothetical protein